MLITHYTSNSLNSNLSVETVSKSAPSAGFGAVATGLGNNTKSAPPFGSSSAKSVDQVARWSKRDYRYALQSVAADVLGSRSRVSSCQKVPSYGVQQSGGMRGISKNAAGVAHYHGVGSCGSVWTCPVCSQRISETRRTEIMTALQQHRENGGIAIMVTWTFSHSKDDDLMDMMKRFSSAMSRAKGRKSYKNLRESVGYIGQVKALEVTHSNANGWHPHCHEIWFLDRKTITGVELDRLQLGIYKVWRQCAVKFGLGEPSLKRGIDVQYRKNGSDSAGAYIAKWGHELTYSQTKKSKKAGRSPWGILSDLLEKWNYTDHCLFNEYARVFSGRSQLFWSKGLKDHFGINDLSDEYISDSEEEEHVCDINREQWGAIVWFKKHAKVLEIAETQSPDCVIQYLDFLVDENRRLYSQQVLSKRKLTREIYQSTIKHIDHLNLDCFFHY